MRRVSKENLESMSIIDLIEKVTEEIKDKPITLSVSGRPYTNALAQRLSLTSGEAVLLSFFIDNCGCNHITYTAMTDYFNCRILNVLKFDQYIGMLVRKGVIIKRRDNNGDTCFMVPHSTLEALLEDKMPRSQTSGGLKPRQWFKAIENFLEQRKNGNINDAEFSLLMNELNTNNEQLPFLQKLSSHIFLDSDYKALFIMLSDYIRYSDERIMEMDFEDYFTDDDLDVTMQLLREGIHPLMTYGLVENACDNGQIDGSAWCLTDYCKNELFAQICPRLTGINRDSLTKHENIKQKKLYYTPNVTRQVKQLQSLLKKRNMDLVLKRLEQHGMRKGFTCLFYGGPGTGKTETVLQLARETKRDIMLVDIPSIRSKWVGDTEKNIKGVFNNYRTLVKTSSELTPILLFNEADAILNKRKEDSGNSVDKMENAMQNIILQEMEVFEGIMVATTNLTSSLDDAFERRFLFKIEFEKPTPIERKHIWRAMLPDLKPKDALSLAEHFDFTGGQIENIARKRIISDILEMHDGLDLDSVIESCKNEVISSKGTRRRVGFLKN